ncbi:hypothetical protein CHUAL_001901 [Chamberlinius hualienensis]
MKKATLLIFITGCLTSTVVNCAPTSNGPTTNKNQDNASDNYKSGANPLEHMFRVPQYGIPYPTQYPYPTGGSPQYPYGQTFFPPPAQGSSGYGGYPFNPSTGNPNPVGYTVPLTPNPAYGQLGNITPNPAYGQFGNGGGSVPVVTTRLNNNAGVVQPGNPYASVSVQSAPGEGPLYRSQTVTGSDGSYGSAFAYSSG